MLLLSASLFLGSATGFKREAAIHGEASCHVLDETGGCPLGSELGTGVYCIGPSLRFGVVLLNKMLSENRTELVASFSYGS